MQPVETFVERWFDGEGNTLEVWFVEAISLFELRAKDQVLFASGRFVDVLHFCLRDETPAPITFEGASAPSSSPRRFSLRSEAALITEPIDLSPEE